MPSRPLTKGGLVAAGLLVASAREDVVICFSSYVVK
jgi:hypothetical protein